MGYAQAEDSMSYSTKKCLRSMYKLNIVLLTCIVASGAVNAKESNVSTSSKHITNFMDHYYSQIDKKYKNEAKTERQVWYSGCMSDTNSTCNDSYNGKKSCCEKYVFDLKNKEE